MRRAVRAGGFGVVVAAFLVYSLLPFYWILASSLRSTSALARAVSSIWPSRPTLTHYVAVFAAQGFGRPLLNSFFVAGLTAAVAVLLGGLAAYGLARTPMHGKRAVLAFVLIVSFFPQIAIVGPLFLVFRHLAILNTYESLVLPYLMLTLPLTVWMLVAFFQQIPRELEEAAAVDGAGVLQTLVRVVAPVAAPGLFTAVILAFILAWNDLLFALSFIQSPGMYTAPLALVNFREAYYVNYGQVDAGVVIVSLPIAVLVLLLQGRVAAGLTAGSLKD